MLYHVGENFHDKTVASAIRWIYLAHKMGADRLGHATALGLNVMYTFLPVCRPTPVARIVVLIVLC